MAGEGSIYLCEERGEKRCLTKCRYKGTKHKHSLCPDFTNVDNPISMREQIRRRVEDE